MPTKITTSKKSKKTSAPFKSRAFLYPNSKANLAFVTVGIGKDGLVTKHYSKQYKVEFENDIQEHRSHNNSDSVLLHGYMNSMESRKNGLFKMNKIIDEVAKAKAAIEKGNTDYQSRAFLNIETKDSPAAIAVNINKQTSLIKIRSCNNCVAFRNTIKSDKGKADAIYLCNTIIENVTQLRNHISSEIVRLNLRVAK